MRVKIDSREQSRIKSAKQFYENQGLEVEVCELEVGDYLFDDKVVFEFKTVLDYVSSVQDHRVFNQAVEMAENFDYAFVVIQGNDSQRAKAISMSKHYQPITYFQYLSSIASLNRYVTVIESYSPLINEAYHRMQLQAQKCLQNKPIVKRFPRKDKNPAFNWLCYCVYGISAKKAQLITDTYHINTLQDLQKLTIKQLTTIEGIGEKTAQNIIKSIL